MIASYIPVVNDFKNNVIMYGCKLCKYLILEDFIVEGEEHARYPGSTLYVCNHYGALETFALRSYIVNAYTITKSDTFTANTNSKALAFVSPYLFQALNLVSYTRGDKGSGQAARIAMAGALKSGKNFISYPEGGSQRSGLPKPFYPGSFEVAAENNITVVPVSIHYHPWSGLKPGDRIKLDKEIAKGLTLRMTFHKPVKNTDGKALAKQCFDIITQGVKDKMAKCGLDDSPKND